MLSVHWWATGGARGAGAGAYLIGSTKHCPRRSRHQALYPTNQRHRPRRSVYQLSPHCVQILPCVKAVVYCCCFCRGFALSQVLKGVDLHIPAGTTCALVGRSGSGKTTLVHMLLRFYDPRVREGRERERERGGRGKIATDIIERGQDIPTEKQRDGWRLSQVRQRICGAQLPGSIKRRGPPFFRVLGINKYVRANDSFPRLNSMSTFEVQI